MTVLVFPKTKLKNVIKYKENKLTQLLQDIEQFEQKIPLSKRKKLRGYQKVQRLKKQFLPSETDSQKDFKKTEEIRNNCYDYLLQVMRKLYADYENSKENIKDFLKKDNKAEKKNIRKLKDILNFDKSRVVNKRKNESQANFIYQKARNPKFMPTPKEKYHSSSCAEYISSPDSTEINYMPFRNEFPNNLNYCSQENNLRLEAKPNSTSIATALNDHKWPGLEKYRVKPSRLQPSVKVSPKFACKENNRDKFDYYGNLFENIFYNQIRLSFENSLTNV